MRQVQKNPSLYKKWCKVRNWKVFLKKRIYYTKVFGLEPEASLTVPTGSHSTLFRIVLGSSGLFLHVPGCSGLFWLVLAGCGSLLLLQTTNCFISFLVKTCKAKTKKERKKMQGFDPDTENQAQRKFLQ